MLYKVSNISDIATLTNTKEARIQHLLRYVFFEKSFNMLNDQTCMYKPGRVCVYLCIFCVCFRNMLCSWMEIEELNHITISHMIDFHMCIISFRCYESVPLNFALICPFKAGATRRSRLALEE